MDQSVIDRLLYEPESFSLFQAIWLLQQSHQELQPVGFHGKIDDEVIRLSGVASLSFPVSVIESIEKDESHNTDRYKLETTSPGLYGILSPLPVNYTASLINSIEEDFANSERIKEFLDMFNHRLLSLEYRVEENRLFHRSSNSRTPPIVFGLFSMLGQFRELDVPSRIEPLLMNFGISRLALAPTRSALALTGWLEYQFEGLPIQIEEFTPRWVSIPTQKQNRLGSDNCFLASEQREFGSTVMLGEWIEDRETSFRIRLGPLRWSQFVDLLPGRKDHQRLPDAVDLFLGEWFHYDLLLELAGQDCHQLQTRLDGESSQIGLTAGLFSESGDGPEFQLILEVESGATIV